MADAVWYGIAAGVQALLTATLLAILALRARPIHNIVVVACMNGAMALFAGLALLVVGAYIDLPCYLHMATMVLFAPCVGVLVLVRSVHYTRQVQFQQMVVQERDASTTGEEAVAQVADSTSVPLDRQLFSQISASHTPHFASDVDSNKHRPLWRSRHCPMLVHYGIPAIVPCTLFLVIRIVKAHPQVGLLDSTCAADSMTRWSGCLAALAGCVLVVAALRRTAAVQDSDPVRRELITLSSLMLIAFAAIGATQVTNTAATATYWVIESITVLVALVTLVIPLVDGRATRASCRQADNSEGSCLTALMCGTMSRSKGGANVRESGRVIPAAVSEVSPSWTEHQRVATELKMVLATQVGMSCFQRHLQKEFSAENLRFFQVVHKYLILCAIADIQGHRPPGVSMSALPPALPPTLARRRSFSADCQSVVAPPPMASQHKTPLAPSSPTSKSHGLAAGQLRAAVETIQQHSADLARKGNHSKQPDQRLSALARFAASMKFSTATWRPSVLGGMSKRGVADSLATEGAAAQARKVSLMFAHPAPAKAKSNSYPSIAAGASVQDTQRRTSAGVVLTTGQRGIGSQAMVAKPKIGPLTARAGASALPVTYRSFHASRSEGDSLDEPGASSSPSVGHNSRSVASVTRPPPIETGLPTASEDDLVTRGPDNDSDDTDGAADIAPPTNPLEGLLQGQMYYISKVASIKCSFCRERATRRLERALGVPSVRSHVSEERQQSQYQQAVSQGPLDHCSDAKDCPDDHSRRTSRGRSVASIASVDTGGSTSRPFRLSAGSDASPPETSAMRQRYVLSHQSETSDADGADLTPRMCNPSGSPSSSDVDLLAAAQGVLQYAAPVTRRFRRRLQEFAALSPHKQDIVLLREGHCIYHEFVRIGAPFQVNLGSTLRHHLGYCVMSGASAAPLLATAQQEIYNLMASDAFKRFLRTERFTQYCRIMQAEDGSRSRTLGGTAHHLHGPSLTVGANPWSPQAVVGSAAQRSMHARSMTKATPALPSGPFLPV